MNPDDTRPRSAPLAAALRISAEILTPVRAGRSLNDVLDTVRPPAAGPSQGGGRPLGGQRAGFSASVGGHTLDPATRGAVQDLCYGTLRAFGRGDFFLARLLARPLPEPVVHSLLLVALWRLETRPDQAHTTVDQAVIAAGALAGGRLRGLVNGVLRNFLRRREALLRDAQDDLQARLQHPQWWVRRLQRDWPQQWEAIVAAGNGHPPMTLRVNRRRAGVQDMLARLDAAGIAARHLGGDALLLGRPVAVEQVPGFADGLVSVQDWGAQQAAALLDAAPGQRVLDACAAPGGKTAHLLERAELDLTAVDVDARRLARVGANLERLGLQARLLQGDARAPAPWWDGRPFDRVLADVPCSASGVVRRHPDIKWLRRESDIAGFAATQREMLEALWPLLAPGGKLLYATCSVFAEENECPVADFAARHDDCRRHPVDGAMGQPAGGTESLQLLPRPEHDGFYYALLGRCR